MYKFQIEGERNDGGIVVFKIEMNENYCRFDFLQFVYRGREGNIIFIIIFYLCIIGYRILLNII